MGTVSPLLALLLVLGVADCAIRNRMSPDLTDSKQGIKMGVSSEDCDDGKVGLEKDWDGSPEDYTCSSLRGPMEESRELQTIQHCADAPAGYHPQHHCMNETIEYDEEIPTFGDHRPLWATFGEYQYLPPQRWLHNIEHGSVIMLYHPCADSGEVDKLRQLVRGCIRKHVITPYNKLSLDRPLALVAWGCRLEMSEMDAVAARTFIREKGLLGPEGHMSRQGQFDVGLLHRAGPPAGSDIEDSVLCPNQP